MLCLVFAASACGAVEETPISDQLASVEVSTTTIATDADDEETITSIEDSNDEPQPDDTTNTLCTQVDQIPETLFVSFEWQPGEERQLTRTLTRDRADSPVQTSHTPVTLTATEVTGEATQLEWVYGPTELEGASAADLAVLNSIVPPRIQYSLDSAGAFVSISNIAEIRTQLDESVGQLVEIAGLDEQTVSQLRQTYNGLSDEGFTSTFVEEIRVLHEFDGTTTTPGLAEEFDGTIPNPLGVEPFDAKITLSAAPKFDSENCATISLVTIPDPETTPAILADTVGAAFGLEIDEFLEQFEVRNEVTLQLDVATSLPRRVTSIQTINILDQQSVETESLTYAE